MDMRKLIALLGGALLVLALVFAFTPVTVGTPTGGYDCGRPFGDTFANDIGASLGGMPRTLVADCSDKRGSRRTLVLFLGIPGAFLLAGALLRRPLVDREPESVRGG